MVHLAHAYSASKERSRKERVQEALDRLGVSVFSGMVTSVVAAIPLFLCTLQFFAKFGFFLMMTVIWSWVWAHMYFLVLMYFFGPDATTPAWLQVR